MPPVNVNSQPKAHSNPKTRVAPRALGVLGNPEPDQHRLSFGSGLAKANHLIALLVLPALLKKLHTLKAFQNVPFGSDSACALETTMLRHKKKSWA